MVYPEVKGKSNSKVKHTTKVNTRLKLAFIVQQTKVTPGNNFGNTHR